MKLNQEKIGLFIQSCRREQQLTQAELGERLHVTAQSVSHWERGETLPDVSVLPELAGILRCSVDAILLGGEGCIGYRRHVTVAQMRTAMDALGQIGMLLGQDHFVYRTMVDALNERMNSDIERAWGDPHIMEIYIMELLMACVRQGDYVDPRDVTSHLKDSVARTMLLDMLREKGIR